MKLNPFLDQGVDIRFLPGSYPMDLPIETETDEVEYIEIPAWRMSDGEMVAVQDMKTSHIQNCIAMIRRSKGWRKQYLPVFNNELKRRMNF